MIKICDRKSCLLLTESLLIYCCKYNPLIYSDTLLVTWTSRVSQSVQGNKVIKTVHKYISVLYVVNIMHIM